MKLQDYNRTEARIIAQLEGRSAGGDNEASKILLKHIVESKVAIAQWQAAQPEREDRKS